MLLLFTLLLRRTDESFCWFFESGIRNPLVLITEDDFDTADDDDDVVVVADVTAGLLGTKFLNTKNEK